MSRDKLTQTKAPPHHKNKMPGQDKAKSAYGGGMNNSKIKMRAKYHQHILQKQREDSIEKMRPKPLLVNKAVVDEATMANE